MKDRQVSAMRPSPAHFFATILVLSAGVVPLPSTWVRARAIRESTRSLEGNRVDRETEAGGYYEGIIRGSGRPDGDRGELTLRLLGKPTGWVRFQADNVTAPCPKDFLQFTLRPNLDRPLFDGRFTTNSLGMRDRPATVEKPEGVTRVALLGSSIDMGWGVNVDETYENILEDWLNAKAVKAGSKRRFEVLNFAVAAYGPAQRVETFRRIALRFQPDLVLYSATMLDPRLLEIHVGGLLQGGLDLRYAPLKNAVIEAGITPEDLRVDSKSEFVNKRAVKTKLKDRYPAMCEDMLEILAAECRSAGLPLVALLVPRAGKSDAPETRRAPVARFKSFSEKIGVKLIDLTSSFDKMETSEVELSAWDDHPNARGHRKLFIGLAEGLAALEESARLLELSKP